MNEKQKNKGKFNKEGSDRKLINLGKKKRKGMISNE